MILLQIWVVNIYKATHSSEVRTSVTHCSVWTNVRIFLPNIIPFLRENHYLITTVWQTRQLLSIYFYIPYFTNVLFTNTFICLRHILHSHWNEANLISSAQLHTHTTTTQKTRTSKKLKKKNEKTKKINFYICDCFVLRQLTNKITISNDHEIFQSLQLRQHLFQ